MWYKLCVPACLPTRALHRPHSWPHGQQATARPAPRRYTLPDLERALAAGPAACHAARRTTLADMTSPGGAHNYELPRINKAFAMRPHRYVYASAAAASDSAFLDSIAKVGGSAGAVQKRLGKHRWAGEVGLGR